MSNYLSDGNSKYKDSKLRVLTWGIPALRSESGLVTCPGAGFCASVCYAQQGRLRMANCRKAQERRLALSQSPKFAQVISGELRRRKWDRIRIHDTGDFYSRDYLEAWLKVMEEFPDKSFFAYTKNVPLFKVATIPGNFHVIYSLGGKYDHMVDLDKDFHSRIFETEEAAKAAGYQVSPDEFPLSMHRAYTREALVYHGNKSWKTCTGGK